MYIQKAFRGTAVRPPPCGNSVSLVDLSTCTVGRWTQCAYISPSGGIYIGIHPNMEVIISLLRRHDHVIRRPKLNNTRSCFVTIAVLPSSNTSQRHYICLVLHHVQSATHPHNSRHDTWPSRPNTTRACPPHLRIDPFFCILSPSHGDAKNPEPREPLSER